MHEPVGPSQVLDRIVTSSCIPMHRQKPTCRKIPEKCPEKIPYQQTSSFGCWSQSLDVVDEVTSVVGGRRSQGLVTLSTTTGKEYRRSA
ncbi:hypothetical protein V7x_37590 [Crateriforma conspicua]|uniref:Uncharacterized protein n=1 Tax=Crateriforma conspicua TaxID=2527996 RepID=A0A5C6FIT7_9PLAN|nr:hypothetical protein V7x_37590 [Crateriforma conspicua]